ncbi:hypothetical protein BJ165DRAFT_1614768 [Panaeolus papilionaceus]|nr:hypothetical protein BJ165DRAFT_1614768 [Panaeolus papilionaceus]
MSQPTPSVINACSRYPAQPLQSQNPNVQSVAALLTDMTKSGQGPICVTHPMSNSPSSIATITAAMSRCLFVAPVQPSLSAVPAQPHLSIQPSQPVVPAEPYLFAQPTVPATPSQSYVPVATPLYLSAGPVQPSPSVHIPSTVIANSLGATTPTAPILGVAADTNLQHLRTQEDTTDTNTNTLLIGLHDHPNASHAATVAPASTAQTPVEENVDNIDKDNKNDEDEEDYADLNHKVKEFRRIIAAQKRKIAELRAKGTVDISLEAFLDDVPNNSIPKPSKGATHQLQKNMGLANNWKIYLAMHAVVRGCMNHCAENYKTVWWKQDREYVMTVINVVRSRCPEFRRYQGGWPIEAMMSTSGKYKQRADHVKVTDPLGLKKKSQADARLMARVAELVHAGGIEALGIAGLAGLAPQAVDAVQVNQVNETDAGILVVDGACTEEAPATKEFPVHLSLPPITQPIPHHIHPPYPAPYVLPNPVLQLALPVQHSAAPEPAILPAPAPYLASPIPQHNDYHILQSAYIENYDYHPVQHHVQLAETTISDAHPPARDDSLMPINISGLVNVLTSDTPPQVNTIAPPASNAPAIVETTRTLRSWARAATTSAQPPAKKPRTAKKAADSEEATRQEGEGGQATGKGKGKGRRGRK